MRIEGWVYTIPLRLRSLFRRARLERELDEELRYHVERVAEEHVARGLTPEAARLAALRAMDGIEQQKERCRDARGVRLIEDGAADFRHGCRALRRDTRFTLVAIATLALGVGLNTAVFSLVNGVMLRGLPYRDADRLVSSSKSARASGRRASERPAASPRRCATSSLPPTWWTTAHAAPPSPASPAMPSSRAT
jgi:hypothetical protein